MSEIIERAANAAMAKLCELDDGPIFNLDSVPDWTDLVIRSRADFIEIIRATIEALREPTEAMWFAPVAADCFVNGVYPTGEEVRAIWMAMIDEAGKP